MLPGVAGSARFLSTFRGEEGKKGGTGKNKGPMARLLIKSDGFQNQVIELKLGATRLGRSPENDFQVEHPTVSATHCEVQLGDGEIIVRDCDSTNGTFIDGDQIKGDAPLAPGATVRFGDISLVFEPTDDAAAVAKGGGTRVMEQMIMSTPPTRPAPAVPTPAPKAAKPPTVPKPGAAKPAPAKPKAGAKAPVAQEKKGKGCGGSAAVLLFGIIGLIYWMLI